MAPNVLLACLVMLSTTPLAAPQSPSAQLAALLASNAQLLPITRVASLTETLAEMLVVSPQPQPTALLVTPQVQLLELLLLLTAAGTVVRTAPTVLTLIALSQPLPTTKESAVNANPDLS